MTGSKGDPASPSRASRCAPEAAGASSPSVTPAIAWQSMETAPKDGSFVDLWLGNAEYPDRRPDCYWGRPHHECGEMGRYCDSCPPDRDMWCDPLSGSYVEDLKPTHWMPRPPPPAESPVAEGHAPEGDRDA